MWSKPHEPHFVHLCLFGAGIIYHTMAVEYLYVYLCMFICICVCVCVCGVCQMNYREGHHVSVLDVGRGTM